jgi:hypothetical protein
MGKWSHIEALLDRAVQKETKRIIAKAKAAMGLGNGNGHTKPITTKRLNRAIRRTDKAVAKAYHAESPIVASFKNKKRVLHGKFLGISRPLPKGEKERISKIYKEKGVRAAIKEAKASREAMR